MSDSYRLVDRPELFNESDYDYQRGNTEFEAVAAGVRTVDGDGDELINYNAKGGFFFVDITAVSGTSPTMRIDLKNKDPSSGDTKIQCAMSTKTATGDYHWMVYPTAPNSVQGGLYAGNFDRISIVIPRTFLFAWDLGGTNPSFTFSIGAMLII